MRDAFPKESGSTYRHWLSRVWGGDENLVLIVAINPSTACAVYDDRFISDMQSILRLSYSGMIVVNVCDYRTTNPEDLKHVLVPRSSSNLSHIEAQARRCRAVIISYGVTDYGTNFKIFREQTLNSIKTLFPADRRFVFGVNGKPYYYNQRNLNSHRVDGKLYPCKC